MPMLVCRKCYSDLTKIENVENYKKKRIVKIRCANCDNTWHVSAPVKGDLHVFLNCDKIIYNSFTTDFSSNYETDISLAFKMAMEKKDNKN